MLFCILYLIVGIKPRTGATLKTNATTEATTRTIITTEATHKTTARTEATTKTITTTEATTKTITRTEALEKTVVSTGATEKIITASGATARTLATTTALKKTIPISKATAQTTTNETTEKTTATSEATNKTVATTLAAEIETSGATITIPKTTTPATYFPHIFIHVHKNDRIDANVTNNTETIITLLNVQSESPSFYVAVFWVPIAVLSLVMVIVGIRTIWRLHDRKRKATLPFYETYESRFVLSEGDNVAYDKINEPENVYLELNGMSTTASSSTDGEGNQYYSTVGSIRDHAKFRSDNRALADPASSREGIISDGQPQRLSEANAYLYLIP